MNALNISKVFILNHRKNGKKKMKFIVKLVILGLIIIFFFWIIARIPGLAYDIVFGHAQATTCVSIPEIKCGKDPTPPDPNRPYYDENGNQYTWDRKLIYSPPKIIEVEK